MIYARSSISKIPMQCRFLVYGRPEVWSPKNEKVKFQHENVDKMIIFRGWLVAEHGSRSRDEVVVPTPTHPPHPPNPTQH